LGELRLHRNRPWFLHQHEAHLVAPLRERVNNSAVTPNAAVNHTEFAQSSIHRTYQPSNSAVLRRENSRTIDLSEMTSAGFGVSAIAPALAAATSRSVFKSFQYSKYCFAVAGSATRWPTLVWPEALSRGRKSSKVRSPGIKRWSLGVGP